MRRILIKLMVLILGGCVSCQQSKAPPIVVVHVLRDPSSQFAERMRRADLQFGLAGPHLRSGAGRSHDGDQ